MKKLHFTLTLLFIAVFSQAQIVNIPDANFKAALLEYSPAIDTNSDGEIQVSEALFVTSLISLQLSYSIVDVTGIEAFSNLTSLKLDGTYITSLNLTSLTNLQNLNCSYCYNLTSLNLSGLINLQTLNCFYCSNLTSLNVSGLTNLLYLNCYDNSLTSLDVSGLNNLQNLNCRNSSLTSLDLSGLTNLQNLNCSYSTNLTSLITTGANNIINLDCSNNTLTSLIVSNMTNLQTLNCSGQRSISSVGISNIELTGLNFLTSLDCSVNNLTSIDVSNLSNLTYLNCSGNLLTNLNVTPLINLIYLNCSDNQLTSLNVVPLINLTNLYCWQNLLNTIDLNALTQLNSLACGFNNITTLNLSNNSSLTNLNCENNQITTLDLSNLHYLTNLYCSNNLFTTLDISQSINNIQFLSFGYKLQSNPNLTSINLKNGVNHNSYILDLNLIDCPNLQLICIDDFNIPYLEQILTNDNLTNIQVNSYCTFIPGGIHNTITGTATLDINNNGCDANDFHPKDVKININDGTLSGASFSNTAGNYSFFTQTGNFELTPQFENPYFTISPATATLNFASLDGSTQTQNFCITPNGVHNDVEIAIIPILGARPGFDANYQLIYKNKGNQTLSGAINLAFDDAVLDFVSAMPTLDNQSANNLVWNYTNLLPFESRSINFTLNVNSPQEIPAVNINDILNFTAAINPISGDETVTDNTFTLNQTVIGSYDPNDKACLEGNTISPDKVGDYLHYLIRFQNSGTAPAENIVVKDMIDTTKFDINSLQLTSTSHPQVTRIKDDKVEFIFEGINLPAEQDNELASHGYVAFKIKTKNNLVLGNSVSNTAAIYFDYNFPIVTNTATSTVAVLSNTEFENKSVRMYPNPAKNNLTIVAKETITSVQLFDVQGRLISTKLNAATETNLDLSQQSSGAYFVKVFTDNGVKIEKVVKE